ncbi:MAG: glycosyltransferase family 2 protein [Lachnospiraceae bacterium]|nr:glycosyltransferase family 2 protein [Lachnospiraceae bacterium]
MNNQLSEKYIMVGTQFLNLGEIEKALLSFIKAYEEAPAEELLNSIKDIFVTPNEEEFRKYYNESFEMTNLPYEKLSIDFFPVNERRFYLFDNEQKKFDGVLDLDDFFVEEEEDNLDFRTLLVCEKWNLVQLDEVLKSVNWSAIYFVGEDIESKVYSFLKIPEFKTLFEEKIVCFESPEYMRLLFETNPNFYLPKAVVGENTEVYERMLVEIHEARIHDTKTPRENVFLSICIPSYNRGELAYNNILRLCNLPYDAEIEFIISDNGSEKEQEYYQKIAEINDVRVHYHRFDVNQEYEGNINQIVKMASGKFIFFLSDEDAMRETEVQGCMNYLINHPFIGAAYFNDEIGDDVGMYAGDWGMIYASICNYVSGVILNNELIREYNIVDFVEKNHGNKFVFYYTHCVYAMALVKHAPFDRSNKQLCLKRIIPVDDTRVFRYAWPEQRAQSLAGVMEVIDQLYENETFDVSLILELLSDRAYYLMWIMKVQSPEAFEERYTWQEACDVIHTEVLELCDKYRFSAGKKKIVEEGYYTALKREESGEKLRRK